MRDPSGESGVSEGVDARAPREVWLHCYAGVECTVRAVPKAVGPYAP